MKLYGYPDEGLPIEEIVPAELAEVTVNATPAELRSMAEFLRSCANEMDRMGDTYGHIHLSDHMKDFRDSPQFVVMRTPSEV
jgi:hypothetical protein